MGAPKQVAAPAIAELQRRLAAEAAADAFDAVEIADYAKSQAALDLRRALAAIPGLNQSKLAAMLGYSKQYVSEALNDEQNFSIETLARFCAALKRHLIVRIISADEAMPLVPMDRLDDVIEVAYSQPSITHVASSVAIGMALNFTAPLYNKGDDCPYGKVQTQSSRDVRHPNPRGATPTGGDA